jgi:regulatory protein
LRLLAQREHSRQQLQKKLARRDFDGEMIESLLDGLEAQGLLSDLRFCESYVEMRVRKGYGPLRIRAELSERGVDEALIEQTLSYYAEGWWSQLQRVHDAKYGGGSVDDRRELARRARFLEYRGFPAAMIRELLID